MLLQFPENVLDFYISRTPSIMDEEGEKPKVRQSRMSR
jgi:hypothetical protein